MQSALLRCRRDLVQLSVVTRAMTYEVSCPIEWRRLSRCSWDVEESEREFWLT